MSTINFRHAKLLQDCRKLGVTVEDLARAWASMDGKQDRFDAGVDKTVLEDDDGTYHGYLEETEELIRRAISYAQDRVNAPLVEPDSGESD